MNLDLKILYSNCVAFIPQIKRSKVVPFNEFGLENSVFKLCSVLYSISSTSSFR